MNLTDWATGNTLGLQIPAHGEALRAGGVSFLTAAFRRAGALAPDNRVTRITQFDECTGGSTGRKLFLSVEYERPEPGAHTQLFVKFSRDFDDAIRDRARNQLEAEVRLALLSRTPGFPIAVPACLFADYQSESGTGILITQRVAFGSGDIEPLHEKCMDYAMPQPLEHYRALLKTLARLAGSHKGGRLASDVAAQFPYDADTESGRDRIRYSEAQLLRRVEKYADFAARYPQLLPPHIRSPEFIAGLGRDIPRCLQQEPAIRRFLHGKPEFIALCHWNANVDNAWFWRDARGDLQCGLMDWGRVGQMSIALALFGALSAAEIAIWNDHLDELLALFAAEFQACGGAALDVGELRLHLLLYASLMGLAWLMDAPALIQAQLPELSQIESRFDPRFERNETARVQLHMMATVMNLWQVQGFGELLDGLGRG
jgi:hypothetical protein